VNGDVITASEYLVMDADVASGGQAKFWFSGTGTENFAGDTVYLQKGDLSTFTGNIVSKADVVVKRNLKVNAKNFYGDGAGKMFYISEGSGAYTSNTLYSSSSITAEAGSIEAKKDLVANRYLLIGTGGSKLTEDSGAKLWYCHRAENQNSLSDKSLYLDSGDFQTSTGSLHAQYDLVATRELFFSSSGDAFGDVKSSRARLWYAHKDSGDTVGNSLYMRDGDFATETGNIISPENLVTAKYLAIGALPGFATISSDKLELYYSAKPRGGTTESVLFLKKGNLRLEKGSVYSKEMKAGREIVINAMEGYGEESTAFFYIDTPFGTAKLEPKSLYLKSGADFRVSENIYSAKHVVAEKSLMVEAKKGFGSGAAELWFGKKGGPSGELQPGAGAPNTLYLRKGTFAAQAGDLMAKLDVETISGEIKIAPRETSGQIKPATPDQAELWYSQTGSSPVIGSKSLYLRSGNFATMEGNIASDKNIRAHPKIGTLKGPKVRLKDSMTCNKCEIGRVYVLPHSQQKIVSPHGDTPMNRAPDTAKHPRLPTAPKTVLEESMVLLDESSAGGGSPAIDLEVALRKLQQRHTHLRKEESHLIEQVDQAKRRLVAAEGQLRSLLRR